MRGEHGCWGPRSDALHDEQALLTAELSLEPSATNP